jgi:hexokinase
MKKQALKTNLFKHYKHKAPLSPSFSKISLPKISSHHQSLKKQLTLSSQTLIDITQFFLTEINNGLHQKKSSLKMLKTYIKPSHQKKRGLTLAIDWGGSNLRILKVNLDPKIVNPEEIDISKKIQKKISPLEKKHPLLIFDHIAQHIRELILEKNNQTDISLGFTISFSLNAKNASHGQIIALSKEFCEIEIKGKDPHVLLQNALKKNHLSNIKIKALLNDTTGTLITKAYFNQNCDVSMILGSGTNICLLIDNMIYVTESGDFAIQQIIPRTEFDKTLDRNSENPGQQIAEKMISGAYLGEFFRLIILKTLTNLQSSHLIHKKNSFPTPYLSEIEKDTSLGLKKTKQLLTTLQIDSTLATRIKVKKIIQLISNRSAKIAAACLAGSLKKIDPTLSQNHVVAIDGSIFEKYYKYSERMISSLNNIFKKNNKKINLVLTKNGSLLGAAIAALNQTD